MSDEKRAQLAEYWGVGVPLWERYAGWLADALHGDLGTSLRFNAPVARGRRHARGELARPHGVRLGARAASSASPWASPPACTAGGSSTGS